MTAFRDSILLDLSSVEVHYLFSRVEGCFDAPCQPYKATAGPLSRLGSSAAMPIIYSTSNRPGFLVFGPLAQCCGIKASVQGFSGLLRACKLQVLGISKPILEPSALQGTAVAIQVARFVVQECNFK